jgi:hypothetical protein
MTLKSIPIIGDSNWGTPLNAHLAQLQNPTNGGINSFEQFSQRPTYLTADDIGKTYIYTQTGNLHQWTGTTWKVLNESVINVKDYGAVGDGVTDDTAAIKASINASLANNRIEIILNNGLYALTDSITITSCMTLSNGTFIQLTNSKDVIVLEDPSNGMFNIFFNKISLQHKTPSNASQGCLVRQKSVLGFFRWVGNSNSVLCNNGFQGFRSEAPIYLSTFDSVWIYSTWAEGIWIPANGAVNTISESLGGCTTCRSRTALYQNVKTLFQRLEWQADMMIL